MTPRDRSLRPSRLAGWLAALALALQLFAPALCLAQRLSAMPLGGVCSAAAPGAAAADVPLPDGASALHALQHCGHCAVPTVFLAAPAATPWAPAAGVAAALPHAEPAPPAAPVGWRPPPRGPPAAG